MAKYDEFTSPKNPGRPVRVESAKRDGSGKNIENNYAKQTGYYAELGVGQADGIASKREIEDTDIACPPISFGIAGGDAEIQTGMNKFEYLEGKSIKWHQKGKIETPSPSYGDWRTSVSNDVITAVSQKDRTTGTQSFLAGGISHTVTVGHKAFMSIEIKAPVSVGIHSYGLRPQKISTMSVAGEWTTCYIIWDTAVTEINSYWFINLGGAMTTGQEVQIRNPQIFDTTEIFGAGNEPTTIDEFIKAFPLLGSYPYDAGSILSSKSASLISRGKNQFSALNTFIRVVGGETYEISGISAGGVLTEYDINKNLIKTSDTFTDTVDIELDEATAYVKIAATTYEDIMFYNTFAEDGGVYNEEYEEPRVQTIELPNIELRSIGDVKDIAYSTGGGKRRVGYVDLGTLNWFYFESGERFEANPPYLKTVDWNKIGNGICLKYEITSFQNLADKTYALYSNRIMLKDSTYTDAATLKQALSGVYLLYEYTEEQDIPLSENPGWTELVFVDNYGTLEFTTDPAQVPQVEQPYFIRYTVSLVEFLDTAYVKCEGDGNNIATQKEVDEIKDGTVITGQARLADNLTPYGDNSGILSNSKFTFQTSGGDKDVGSVAELRALYGRSMKFQNKITSILSNSGIYALNGSTYTFDETEAVLEINASSGRAEKVLQSWSPAIAGHKMIYILYAKCSEEATLTYQNYLYQGGSGNLTFNLTTSYQQFATMFTGASSKQGNGELNMFNGQQGGVSGRKYYFKNVMLFDLTDIFGAGNEPASIEEFRKIFPKEYYPKEDAIIIHSKSNAYKIVGYNAFDISNPTSFIRVVPEETYTIENTNGGSLEIYDANETLIDTVSLASDYEIVELPVNAYYVKLIDYTSTSCLHLTWDESKIGFEEYYDKIYPLPNIELRGIGNVRDELRPDGTLIRRIGVVDLGTINWRYYSNYTHFDNYYDRVPNLKKPTVYSIPNILCIKYNNSQAVGPSGTDKTITLSYNETGSIFIRDDSFNNDSTAFKEAMSGVLLYYELETPVVETIPQFVSYTDIDDFGTQEFTSELPLQLPQENEIFYVADYKAFMDSLGGREDIEYDANEIVSNTTLREQLENSEVIPSLSDNLTPYSESSGATDTSAFVMQTAGGEADISDKAYLKALRGKTIKWNQKLLNRTFYDLYNQFTDTFDSENHKHTFTINYAMTTNDQIIFLLFKNMLGGNEIINHKCLIRFDFTASKDIRLDWYLPGTSWNNENCIANNKIHVNLIHNINLTSNYGAFQLKPLSGIEYSSGDTFILENFQIIDLTDILGAGNEPTTYEEFTRLFPKPYYEYNAGEIISSKSNSYKTIGFNAFDGELEKGYIKTNGETQNNDHAFKTKNYIKVIPGETYTFEITPPNAATLMLRYYDANKNYLYGEDKTTQNIQQIAIPNECHYIKAVWYRANSNWGVNIPNGLNICIHLTWDSSRTGYEPYNSVTHELPNVELRGIGNVCDELKPDGTLIRRIGIIKLKDLTFNRSTVNDVSWFHVSLPLAKPNNTAGGPGTPNTFLVTYTKNNVAPTILENKQYVLGSTYYGANSKTLSIRDDTYTTVTDFKNHFTDDDVLYYELAEPVIEQTSNTFQEVADIDDFGTQEFLSEQEIQVPQGAEFFYPVDYKAFIDSVGGREDIGYDAGEIVSHTELEEALAESIISVTTDSTANRFICALTEHHLKIFVYLRAYYSEVTLIGTLPQNVLAFLQSSMGTVDSKNLNIPLMGANGNVGYISIQVNTQDNKIAGNIYAKTAVAYHNTGSIEVIK